VYTGSTPVGAFPCKHSDAAQPCGVAAVSGAPSNPLSSAEIRQASLPGGRVVGDEVKPIIGHRGLAKLLHERFQQGLLRADVLVFKTLNRTIVTPQTG
jgi:hypothetical protein